MGRKHASRNRPKSVPRDASQNTGKARFIKLQNRHVFAAAALLVLVLSAYSNSFSGGFTFDSRNLILQNPELRQASAENLREILHNDYWWPTFRGGLYRPLTTLSYLFNYAVLGNGERPIGYHLINFMLHFLNVLLVYVLCIRLIKQFWPAVFIAALWGVHPMLTESVTNIAGRADLLSATAILAGFLMYEMSTESAGWRRVAWLCGLAAAVFVGVFSKESGVAIVAVIVLYELTWWKDRKQVRSLLLMCLATIPPILVMLVSRARMLGGLSVPVSFTDNPLYGSTFLKGRLTAIAVMGRYLSLLIWPSRLSADYSYAQILLADGSVRDWILWIAVAAAVVATVSMWKWNRLAFFFAAFAIVTFIPTSNLIVWIGTIMAERFVYLPAIGFAACVVLSLFFIGKRIRIRSFAPVMLCLIIVAFGVRCRQRNSDWHDDIALWTSGVRTSPNSYKSHIGLARAMFESDATHANLDAVIEEAERALAILDPIPDSLGISNVYADAGFYYMLKGDRHPRGDPGENAVISAESDRAYQRSIQILLRGLAIDKSNQKSTLESTEPNNPPVGYAPLYRQLARTYTRLGDYQKAYDTALFACELSPQVADGYLVLAELFQAQKRESDEAVAVIEYFLTSRNSRILGPLQKLYRSGLDQQGCAILWTPNGAVLNQSCEIVHNDLCRASVNLIKISIRGGQPKVAEQFKSTAISEYGCPVGSLP